MWEKRRVGEKKEKERDGVAGGGGVSTQQSQGHLGATWYYFGKDKE